MVGFNAMYTKAPRAFQSSVAPHQALLSLSNFIMGSTQEVSVDDRTDDRIVFDTFDHHASAQRIETKQRMLNVIRRQYPRHHVTVVDAGPCSLLEFAAVGKATATFEAEEETFNATREWKPVGAGIEKKTHPGRLNDDYHFAR